MENEKRDVTTAVKIFVAAALVVAAVLVHTFVMPYLENQEMGIVATGRGVNYDFDSSASFHSNDSRLYFYATRDMVRLINSRDATEWQHAQNLNSMTVSARGDYFAVGEQSGGFSISVFNANNNGLLFSVTLDNPVLLFNINETGFLSVVVQYESGFGIYIFNEHRASSPLFHWDIFNDLVTPIHVEVSPDGRYVAITIVDLTFNVKSSVQFRYINQSDAWGTDQGLFATQDFPGEFVTALQFMEGNRLIISTTARIACYQLGPGHTVSRPLWNLELENAKTHIEFYNGTHFAYATGERLPTTTGDGKPTGTVLIYNTNGSEVGSFELGRRVSHLRMGHNSLIVGGERSFHAINFRGTPLWEYTVPFDTRDIIFLDSTNRFLIAGSGSAEIFERRRVREDSLNQEVTNE